MLKELGYKPIRSDKESNSNSISRTIVIRLINSELVIADTSGYNANVFYELAIRNASKKPVIIIKEPEQKLPFDIYDKRAISIDMKDNRQWTNAKDELKQHILNAQKEPRSASESIVSEYAFDLAVSRTPSTEQEMILMIKDLRDEVRTLRNDVKLQKTSPTFEKPFGVVVSIELGSGTSVPKDKNQKLLDPVAVVIKRGVNVVWVNNDRVSHTITSGVASDTNTGTIFDSGLIKSGSTFSFTFNDIGDFPYFDVVHPWVAGIIHVR